MTRLIGVATAGVICHWSSRPQKFSILDLIQEMIDDAGAVFRNDGFVMASTVVGPVVASMVGNGDNLVVAQVVVGSFWYYCVGAPSC